MGREKSHGLSSIQIRILSEDDEEKLEAFLQLRLASSMFMLSNKRTAGLKDSGRPFEGSYAAAFKGDQIVGVVAHYWNQMLVYQAPAQLDELQQAAVASSRRPVRGLIGPHDQVSLAMNRLTVGKSNLQLDEVEGLYTLKLANLIVPDQLRTGQWRGRRIQPEDRDLFTRWRVEFSLEALGAEEGSQLWEQSRASFDRSLKMGRSWILEVAGEPVATSSFNAAIDEAVQIGGVWTPPELRRRGYARAAVAASLLDARSQLVEQAILFTGDDNVPAVRAYEALGFKRVGNYRLILLHEPIEPAA